MNAIAPPPTSGAEVVLYAKRAQIYPQSVQGRFRNIKWILMAITLGIYYFLPFVRWDRGPNAPDQAVLIDFPARKFYFFFIEIWPQELYYVTGLLILASLVLFLMNALAGRVWCGYLCPQTVWTDLFLAVERLVEGDRRERMRKAREPLSIRRVGEIGTKHFLWLMIAWWTGGAWVLYFADAPTLVRDLATFQAPVVAYVWVGILTTTTYLLAGHAREQVCIYMCPWPRIQAALTDEYALNVTYRYDRGEPRMSLKDATRARAKGDAAGDCVDCGQCVAVCPTGVDIRNGPNLSCIQCGLCIDACDTVMGKIGRPSRLIAYDNDVNIHNRQAGRPEEFRPIRARTVLYTGMIAMVGALMLWQFATRSFTYLGVLHDRNPLYVTLSDGSIRNAYTLNLSNKREVPRAYLLTVEGLPGARLDIIGVAGAGGAPILEVPAGAPAQFRVLVTAPQGSVLQSLTPIRFRVMATDDGERVVQADTFKAP
jgi:cytochrome c oxidase accessory protein FixG